MSYSTKYLFFLSSLYTDWFGILPLLETSNNWVQFGTCKFRVFAIVLKSLQCTTIANVHLIIGWFWLLLFVVKLYECLLNWLCFIVIAPHFYFLSIVKTGFFFAHISLFKFILLLWWWLTFIIGHKVVRYYGIIISLLALIWHYSVLFK